MKPQLLRFGNTQSPIVVVDDFSGDAEQIARMADALAPFPAIKGNYYPGLRRIIGNLDGAAYSYVLATCERAAPFIGGAFGVGGFDLDEASFSIVTSRPHELHAVQKAPHFDSPEQDIYALLHYLRVPKGSGTAFYRHRATGIERITVENLGLFVAAASRELQTVASSPGYIQGSNHFYEQIGSVDAVPDRLIIYHGSLLHSGIIPETMTFSGDPKEGRLTANFFLKGR